MCKDTGTNARGHKDMWPQSEGLLGFLHRSSGSHPSRGLNAHLLFGFWEIPGSSQEILLCCLSSAEVVSLTQNPESSRGIFLLSFFLVDLPL